MKQWLLGIATVNAQPAQTSRKKDPKMWCASTLMNHKRLMKVCTINAKHNRKTQAVRREAVIDVAFVVVEIVEVVLTHKPFDQTRQ